VGPRLALGAASTAAVTPVSVRHYVALASLWHTVGVRAPELAALREGFLQIPEVFPLVAAMGWRRLRAVICGLAEGDDADDAVAAAAAAAAREEEEAIAAAAAARATAWTDSDADEDMPVAVVDWESSSEDSGADGGDRSRATKRAREADGLRQQRYERAARRRATVAAAATVGPRFGPGGVRLRASDIIERLVFADDWMLPRMPPPRTTTAGTASTGVPTCSRTPQHLVEVIGELSPGDLRRLLRLCTSLTALPLAPVRHGGQHGGHFDHASNGAGPRGLKINVLRTADTSRLPVGLTCANTLNLPDYNNKAELRRKLRMSLDNVDATGFGYM
jgi:hypothetical protein